MGVKRASLRQSRRQTPQTLIESRRRNDQQADRIGAALKLAHRQVGLGSLANLSCGTIVDAQYAGAALKFQAFMHIRPIEAAAIDGLIGIGSDKDAIRLIAQPYE